MEFDKDLSARQEARTLAKKAAEAQKHLAEMSQGQIDAIVEAVAKAFSKEAEALAEMAVNETGFGNVRDKTVKNKFASEKVAAAGLNIENLVNKSRDSVAYTILDFDEDVTEELVEQLKAIDGVLRVRVL